MFDLHPAAQSQRREHRGQQHRYGLRAKQNGAFGETIGHGAAERSQQEHRNLVAESNQTKQRGRAGQAVDQPGLRDGLHPCADQ